MYDDRLHAAVFGFDDIDQDDLDDGFEIEPSDDQLHIIDLEDRIEHAYAAVRALGGSLVLLVVKDEYDIELDQHEAEDIFKAGLRDSSTDTPLEQSVVDTCKVAFGLVQEEDYDYSCGCV